MERYHSSLNQDRTMSLSDQILLQAFARVDKEALGVAAGAIGAAVIFVSTAVLLVKGGVGSNLALLGQYFLGYTVTWKGSAVGAVYGFLGGFALGWTTAFLRNLFVAIYMYFAKLKASLMSINDLIGHL